MKIASFAAGLALAAGLAVAAPADAQRYHHGGGWHGGGYHGGGYRGGGYRGFHGGYRGGYGYRGYGYYHHPRWVCRWRYGHRRCFRGW